MNLNDIFIRIATPDDADKIQKIYAPYVLNTAITFEYDVPDVSEMKSRIENTLCKYPYIVIVKGKEILGYAYTGAFSERAAYNWSAATAIYLRDDKRKLGLGRLLYQALENISKEQNITNLNACIAFPETKDEYLTENSAIFHTCLGYRMVGEFHKCGYKFGRWYNMLWMEKMIGSHPENPAPVIPFSNLNADTLAKLEIKQ